MVLMASTVMIVLNLNCYSKTRSNHSFKLRQPLARVNCFFALNLCQNYILSSGILPKEIVLEKDFSIFRSKLRKDCKSLFQAFLNYC